MRKRFMRWDTDLTSKQKEAASHQGSHARLLAGPGTGKTLTMTRRILWLISEQQVPPNQILAITFTRAAASELRQQVETHLAPLNTALPRIFSPLLCPEAVIEKCN